MCWNQRSRTAFSHHATQGLFHSFFPTRVYGLLVSSIYPLLFHSSNSIPLLCINTCRFHSYIQQFPLHKYQAPPESLLRIQQNGADGRGIKHPSSDVGKLSCLRLINRSYIGLISTLDHSCIAFTNLSQVQCMDKAANDSDRIHPSRENFG